MSDRMLRQPGRRQQLWLYMAAVLFCADFVFFGYLPSHRRLQSLREAGRQQGLMIQTAAAQSKELPQLRTRLRDTEQVIERYESYIPQRASLGIFLQEIAQIMTKHHLTDQVVVPGRETGSNAVRCVPVRINCKGGLKDLFGFFQDFQAMDRLVRIEKVVLQNSSDFLGQVTIETDAVIFYRPQAQPGTPDVAGGRPEGVNDGV